MNTEITTHRIHAHFSCSIIIIIEIQHERSMWSVRVVVCHMDVDISASCECLLELKQIIISDDILIELWNTVDVQHDLVKNQGL